MREVKLTQGKTALVSDEDFEDVSKFKWYFAKIGGGTAVKSVCWKCTSTGKHRRRIYFLHNFIGEFVNGPLAAGFYFDHKNRNKLDNTRENLRICSHWQNCHNRVNGSAKYKSSGLPVGVFRNGKNGNYFAHIKVKGARHRSKSFPTVEEAVAAYKRLQYKYVGQFAVR